MKLLFHTVCQQQQRTSVLGLSIAPQQEKQEKDIKGNRYQFYFCPRPGVIKKKTNTTLLTLTKGFTCITVLLKINSGGQCLEFISLLRRHRISFRNKVKFKQLLALTLNQILLHVLIIFFRCFFYCISKSLPQTCSTRTWEGQEGQFLPSHWVPQYRTTGNTNAICLLCVLILVVCMLYLCTQNRLWMKIFFKQLPFRINCSFKETSKGSRGFKKKEVAIN